MCSRSVMTVTRTCWWMRSPTRNGPMSSMPPGGALLRRFESPSRPGRNASSFADAVPDPVDCPLPPADAGKALLLVQVTPPSRLDHLGLLTGRDDHDTVVVADDQVTRMYFHVTEHDWLVDATTGLRVLHRAPDTDTPLEHGEPCLPA